VDTISPPRTITVVYTHPNLLERAGIDSTMPVNFHAGVYPAASSDDLLRGSPPTSWVRTLGPNGGLWDDLFPHPARQ
jgi:hypothetical protein